jgi:predicted TIM-barrel fold metal-dependent hydrolase
MRKTAETRTTTASRPLLENQTKISSIPRAAAHASGPAAGGSSLRIGIDRIMFSVDCPHAPNAKGRDFLDGISLAPADMAKLTHNNADALLKLKVGAG